jgi:hypothetical protein
MSDEDQLSDERVLQAFRVIEEHLVRGAPAPPLRTLRERLAGELLGDDRRVAATLAPDFALVTHTGGTATTVAGRDMVDGIGRQGNAGVMLWIGLDDLVVDSDVAAGDGLLHTFRTDPCSLTTFPIAFFIRYADGLMASEVAFMDVSAAVTTPIPAGTKPSVDRLRLLLSL